MNKMSSSVANEPENQIWIYLRWVFLFFINIAPCFWNEFLSISEILADDSGFAEGANVWIMFWHSAMIWTSCKLDLYITVLRVLTVHHRLPKLLSQNISVPENSPSLWDSVTVT